MVLGCRFGSCVVMLGVEMCVQGYRSVEQHAHTIGASMVTNSISGFLVLVIV